MTEENPQQRSRLIGVLREGVGVVQMVLFKELREFFAATFPDRDITFRAMLVGAIINRLFGMENPEEKFRRFNQENTAVIEQELLGLARQFPGLRSNITDALRVMVLCDHQEGRDSSGVLKQAEELGILVTERDIPLPSTFMTLIRNLGEKHGLTVAPVQITPQEDGIIH